MPERENRYRQTARERLEKLPLTPGQQRVISAAFNLARGGVLVPQTRVAEELDITRVAVWFHVKAIREKGHYVPVETTSEIDKKDRKKLEQREKKKRERRRRLDQVRRLRLKKLTLGQIQQKTHWSASFLEGALESLRRTGEIPRVRSKKRTSEEIAADNATIIKLSKLGLSDREIAKKMRRTYRFVTNSKSEMRAKGEKI